VIALPSLYRGLKELPWGSEPACYRYLVPRCSGQLQWEFVLHNPGYCWERELRIYF